MDAQAIHVSEDKDSDTSLEDTTDQMESQDSHPSISTDPKGKKKRRLFSPVWEHFRHLKGQKSMVECKKCKHILKAESKHGTGNLRKHMEKCIKTTTKDIGQFMLSSDKGYLDTRSQRFKQEKFRELVVRSLIRHELPFSFVEYEGVRSICSYLEPEVKHISRNTAKADVKKLHTREMGRLMNELHACPSRICLTSDAWSSIVTDGYLSLTAHFIDSNWVLQKRILNFSYMPPPHSGVALAEKLYNLASSWNIEKKLFSLTLDNASANDVCAGILKNQLKLKGVLVSEGSLFHVRCCAHILNLIVQDGLKEIDAAVDKIRECVKYVKGSQVRKVKFTECIAQTSLDGKKSLVQDVPTRWNSTYKMLSNALYYRSAFCHLGLSDSNFKSCPCDEEWEKVAKICNFLKLFHDATNEFSGSKYPTSNLYFPQVFLIQSTLVEESRSADGYMRKVADQMLVKFNKYWSEFNTLLAIAVVFDPRYKFQMLEYSYQKLYGPSSVELLRVKNVLTSLFKEYADKLSNRPTGSASNSCCSSDTHDHEIGSSSSSATMFKEFDEFDEFEFVGVQKTQLELYLDEPRVKRTSNIDVLEYWNSQQFRFPHLAKLARDILCVPVSTVASESAFSLGGRILDQFRSSLSPHVVEALVCTKDWLFAGKELSDVKLEDLTQDIMSLHIAQDGDEAEDACSNKQTTAAMVH